MLRRVIAAWLLYSGCIFAQDFEALSQQAAAALRSNPAEAAKLYGEAVALRPGWAEGWFYLGASLYGTRQYSDAQKAFQRSAELAPDNGTVWAFLGLCEYQMGAYEQSLADIRRGEELGLGDNKGFISSIYRQAALIYLRRAQFGLAMEQLQVLAVMGDDSVATIEALGVGALGIRALPGEMPADKQDLVRLAGRAAWAVYAHRLDEGRRLAQELAAKYSNEPGVHYLYGLCLVWGDPDAAFREFRKELQIRPGHVPARLQAAALELKAGAPEAALELALEAVKLEPENPFGYIALGRAYLNTGQVAKAEQVLERAVKLGPKSRDAHLYLAQAYQRAGRVTDAEKEQAEFSRLRAVHDPLMMSGDSGTSPAR
jgi:tetratricopeptide (TPR) repeat protein